MPATGWTVVEDCVIVEVKAVESLNSIHQAQLLSYLRMSSKQVGLLINFNVDHLRNRIRRMVNKYQNPPRSSAASAV